MKYPVLILLFALITGTSLAQRPVYETGRFSSSSTPKAVTDTLWPADAASASGYVLVADSLGGYVLGTNSYQSVAIGQHYPLTTSYRIIGGLFWFGYKKVQADESLTFSVWRFDSINGYTMAGENQPGPGTRLTGYTTSLSQVDTSTTLLGAYCVIFDSSVVVLDDYLMGVDFSAFNSDSLALVSTSNGDGKGKELVWEQWGLNQTWHTLQASGWGYPAPLDVDAMILPLVDLSQAGISQAPLINGIRCTLWPNPVVNQLHVSLQTITTENNVQIHLFDLAGKSLQSHNAGRLEAGTHEFSLATNNMADGSYICVISSGTARYAAKFVIAQ